MADEKIIETEKLEEEQLEEVAGGRADETASDKMCMYNLKLTPTPAITDQQLRDLFLARFQIKAEVSNNGKHNVYRLNNGAGPVLNHGQVWPFIANLVKSGK